MTTILLVVLILVLLGGVGSLPRWQHSRSWGYGPSGGMGVVSLLLIVLVVLMLMGRI